MKLNNAQKAILAIGLASLLCLALFPPWREAAQREVDYRKDIGRWFILNPPQPVAVDCYFVGCKTAPASYFHVLINRGLLFSQLITVASVALALLWILRSHRDGTAATLRSFKTRMQFCALIALLIPFAKQYPLGDLLCVGIIFLLLSAIVKVYGRWPGHEP